MKKILFEDLKPGMKLALPIRCGLSYQILLNAGTVINEKHVKRLRTLKAIEIFVHTPEFADYPAKELYNEAVANMDEIFSEFLLEKEIDVPRVKKAVDGVIDHLTAEQHILLQLTRLNNADSYSVSHCVNVAIYSLFLGLKMGLSEQELRNLGLGAILHDIGKLGVPEEILKKPQSLTDEEYSIIKNHPLEGYNALKKNDLSADARMVVRDHHERCDGSGYPFGKEEKDIHKLARIVSIADIYDAVTADRVYRPKMLPHEGLEILLANCAGNKLDQKMVKVFMREICVYPVGSVVRLSTGEIGRVIDFPRDAPYRPTVAVERGDEVFLVNLMKEPTVFIAEIISLDQGNHNMQ